jgi:molybdenum cofactor guanylyltransferase
MTRNSQIFGFVQSGGISRRFGSDKAQSVLGGQTLLVRTTNLVQSVCGNVRIVAAEGKYVRAPAKILADRWPGEGPFGGILTALREVSGSAGAQPVWTLIVGCDMPFLSHEWLAFLCERAMASDAQVVFAESQFGWEPLCACWNMSALEELQSAFDSGVRKVTEGMRRIRREVLDETQWKRFDTGGRLFWNMNTPEDFAEAQRIIENEPR